MDSGKLYDVERRVMTSLLTQRVQEENSNDDLRLNNVLFYIMIPGYACLVLNSTYALNLYQIQIITFMYEYRSIFQSHSLQIQHYN